MAMIKIFVSRKYLTFYFTCDPNNRSLIQRVLAKEAKIADITLRADKIVTGVLKKKEKSTCTEEERNEIISNVTKEIKPIQEEQMLVQQPIG